MVCRSAAGHFSSRNFSLRRAGLWPLLVRTLFPPTAGRDKIGHRIVTQKSSPLPSRKVPSPFILITALVSFAFPLPRGPGLRGAVLASPPSCLLSHGALHKSTCNKILRRPWFASPYTLFRRIRYSPTGKTQSGVQLQPFCLPSSNPNFWELSPASMSPQDQASQLVA